MFKKIFFLAIINFLRIEEGACRAGKIGSGREAKPAENLDYAILSVIFQNQAQKCGGSLIAPQYVLTSATCVFDPVEGDATVVNVTFAQYKTNEYVATKLKVTKHPDYDYQTHANDIAIIKLLAAVPIDPKTVTIGKLETTNTPDVYVDQVLRGCGYGSILNYPTPPQKLQCTRLFGVLSADCSDNPNIICTQWKDRDSNMCNGDYGGPLYQVTEAADKIEQVVVGIAQYSPDYRAAAPCLDGHKVSFAQVAAYIDWITATLA